MMPLQASGDPSPGLVIAGLLGAVPILAIMAWAAVKIFGPVGQALAQRLSGRSSENPLLEGRLDRLSDELEGIRAELAETHERLDFTERMLAHGRTPDPLPRG
jgi:hypothetical protein